MTISGIIRASFGMATICMIKSNQTNLLNNNNTLLKNVSSKISHDYKVYI